MKKYILIIILTCSVTFVWSNVMTPRANISEVFIGSNNDWTIELGFYEYAISEIDSIRIETSSGSSTLKDFTLIPGSGFPGFDFLTVINNSNLSSPISINPMYDFLNVISYSWGQVVIEFLAIGNYPGSFLDCTDSTESISYLDYQQSAGYTQSFCIDTSPTIGFGNDTNGALGSFTGQLFDLDGSLMTNVSFPMPEVQNTTIHIDSNGSFSERIFARRYTFDTITIRIPPWPYIHEQYTIELVDFCLEPETSFNTDIFTTNLITGIFEQQNTYENVVVIAPNPFSSSTRFYLNFETFKISDKLEIKIFSQNGIIIERVALSPNQKKFDWIPNQSIESGILFYQLIRNRQIIKTGKIIKL